MRHPLTQHTLTQHSSNTDYGREGKSKRVDKQNEMRVFKRGPGCACAEEKKRLLNFHTVRHLPSHAEHCMRCMRMHMYCTCTCTAHAHVHVHVTCLHVHVHGHAHVHVHVTCACACACACTCAGVYCSARMTLSLTTPCPLCPAAARLLRGQSRHVRMAGSNLAQSSLKSHGSPG
jgi:hypothetical protein